MLKLYKRAYEGEGTRSTGHLGNKEWLHSVDPEEREKGSERKNWKVVQDLRML